MKQGLNLSLRERRLSYSLIEEAKTEVETALQKYLPQPQTGDLYFNVTKNKEERG